MTKSLVLAALFALLTVAPLAAQEDVDARLGPATEINGVIIGRVHNGTAAGDAPSSGEPMLHIWDADLQERGMLHGTLSPEGSYSIENVPFVVGWRYAVMLTYQDVTYYSEPAAITEGQEKLDLDVTVYETTTATDAVRIARQHLFFDASPSTSADGTKGERLLVGEIYVLSNTGDRTVVQSASAEPTSAPLAFTLPVEARDIGLENNHNGRFKATEDGFVDTAPLLPGRGTAEVVVRYTLPYEGPQTYTFSSPWPVDGLNVLLPASAGLSLDGEGLQALESRQMGNGVEVAVFNRQGLAAGETVTLALSGNLNAPPAAANSSASMPALDTGAKSLLAVVLVAVGVFLLVLAVRFSRQTPQTENVPTEDSSLATYEAVIVEIARLDEARQDGQLGEADYAQRRGLLFAQARQLAPEGQKS